MAFAPSLPQPPARLRLSSPEQVLAAVPYLLGFAPSESVVVLSLRGKQIGLTMRLDLDTPAPTLRETVVERLRIELGDLPFSLREERAPAEPKLNLDELLEKTERNLIRLALEHARGNKSKAAQLLGVWRARLLRRMEQLGINDAEPPGGADDA